MDCLLDFEPHVQNFIIKEILITKSGYLRPCHSFKDSNSALYSFFYSEPKNHDGWALKDLAQLLLLLVQRKALLPVTLTMSTATSPMMSPANCSGLISAERPKSLKTKSCQRTSSKKTWPPYKTKNPMMSRVFLAFRHGYEIS
jgi:hypothetical protein